MNTTQAAEQLTKRLYAAAEKAGMVNALTDAEVYVSFSGGKFFVVYEAEVAERGVEIDYVAIDRAKKWLAAATA